MGSIAPIFHMRQGADGTTVVTATPGSHAQIRRANFPSYIRFGGLPQRDPRTKKKAKDHFGNVFELQTTENSALAQRRGARRATLDIETARAEHAKNWEQYVQAHDSLPFMSYEQADLIALRCRNHRNQSALERQAYVEAVDFGVVNYAYAEQPRSASARAMDSLPVSPTTLPEGGEASRQRIDRAQNARNVAFTSAGSALTGMFYTFADLRPLDLEAQTGVSPRTEGPMYRSFAQALNFAMHHLCFA